VAKARCPVCVIPCHYDVIMSLTSRRAHKHERYRWEDWKTKHRDDLSGSRLIDDTGIGAKALDAPDHLSC
jgi:hypothetical protein